MGRGSLWKRARTPDSSARSTASFRESVFLSGGLRIERNTGLVTGVGEIATLPMLGASAVRSFGIGTLKLRAAYGKGIRPPQTSSRAGTLMGACAQIFRLRNNQELKLGADFFIGSFASLHATRFDQRASGLIQPVSVYSAERADGMPHTVALHISCRMSAK